MDSPTAIVVTRSEHVTAMRERMAGGPPVAVFSDADSLQVMDALLASPPATLVIHTAFAATSRGATLVARLKSEPTLLGTEPRVFIEDGDKAPLILSHTTIAPTEALLETTRPLDRAGTRQAARYPMGRRAALVNGEPGSLIDLSATGAQVQAAARLRPSELVRFAVPDGTTEIRCQATVAWSVAVPADGAVHYRGGLEFIIADSARLEDFCHRFGGAPDPNHGVE